MELAILIPSPSTSIVTMMTQSPHPLELSEQPPCSKSSTYLEYRKSLRVRLSYARTHDAANGAPSTEMPCWLLRSICEFHVCDRFWAGYQYSIQCCKATCILQIRICASLHICHHEKYATRPRPYSLSHVPLGPSLEIRLAEQTRNAHEALDKALVHPEE